MSVTLDFSTAVPLKKNSFKTNEVESEYDNLDPSFKNVIDNSPTPLTITSGARSPEENAAVGGVPNSYHTKNMAVDVRGELDPETQKYLQGSGIKVIPESDHNHLQPGEGFNKPVQLDFSTAQPLNDGMPKPVQDEQPDDGSTFGLENYKKSPLSMIDRLKTSFGNPAGNDEYLRSKGYSQEDIKGSRPDTNSGLYALTPPSLARRSLKGQGPDLGAMATTVRDIPGAIADIPATALNMIPFGGTKAKQGIGELLGTYKDPGQGYFNDEVKQNAILDAATLGMPAAGKVLTGLETKAAQALGTLPEKMYARSAGIPELLDRSTQEIISDETPRGIEKIQSLLRKNYPSNKESLLKAASADKAALGAEKEARLAQIGDIDTRSIEGEASNIAANKLPVGEKEAGRRKINKILGELLPPQFTMKDGGKTIKGPQATTIPASVLEREKSLLDKTYASEAETKIARNEMADLFRNKVREADEPIAYQQGRSIKDINTEYHPLSALTENLTDQINKRTQGGNTAKNFKELFTNMVTPLQERAGRKVGQSLFNYKDVQGGIDPTSFGEAASDVVPAYLTKDIILQYLNQLKR